MTNQQSTRKQCPQCSGFCPIQASQCSACGFLFYPLRQEFRQPDKTPLHHFPGVIVFLMFAFPAILLYLGSQPEVMSYGRHGLFTMLAWLSMTFGCYGLWTGNLSLPAKKYLTVALGVCALVGIGVYLFWTHTFGPASLEMSQSMRVTQ